MTNLAKVIVVGGGPAGIMAALSAAKNNEVTLIERNKEIGMKLRLTGGGRCNITNNRDIEEFFDKIVNNKKFLYSALYTFSNYSLLEYLSNNGLEYKVELDEKVYTKSDKADEVIELLKNDLEKNKVKIRYNTMVSDLIVENEDIKDFCKLLVSELPLYWWEVPASSTGKYHPAYALGDGGLMRHSIAVVRFLNWFFSLEQCQNKFTDRERDLLRCAGLVHDGRKSGASDDVKEVFTVFDHPLLMAEAVRKHKENVVISDKEIELIANAIESHMGQWTTSNKPKDAGIVLPKPSNKYQEIVHLADYLASRKPLDMEFDEWKKPELPPLDTYVLNFGKYKDERLVEVAQKDKGYIDWLKENYGREPVRSLLKQL